MSRLEKRLLLCTLVISILALCGSVISLLRVNRMSAEQRTYQEERHQVQKDLQQMFTDFGLGQPPGALVP